MHVFVASDLAHKRRDVLDAARSESGALIRDTDGTVLAIVDAGRLGALHRLSEITGGFAALAASLDQQSVSSASLGVFSWAAHWSAVRRANLVHDVADALSVAVSLQDPGAVDELIRQARETPVPASTLDGLEMWKALDEEDRERLRTGRGLPRRARAAG